jgi:predicted ATPase
MIGEESELSLQLSLYLLGPPKLELNNAPVAADRRKSLALLAYLALHREKHTREFLSGMLWPEYEQEKAFTNLRHALWETQQAIGEGWVAASRETISLIPDSSQSSEKGIWVDVNRFIELIATSRTKKEISLRIPLLAESAALYRNHFLTGFNLKDAPSFNDWGRGKSEELRNLLTLALTMLSNDLTLLGQFESAIPYAQRLLLLDPLNEEAHRQLMKIHLQAGQVNAALKQYMACEKILRKELGVDPQLETRDLYRQIRKGELKPPQPALQKDTPAPLHNLPYQLSKFIGREKELIEITDLIAGNRLVTLTGTGGIGKTRLSLRCGEQLLNQYPDGIWVAELASLNDPERVPQVVAGLFDLNEGSENPPNENLIRFLRPKTMLLILDNCEHLLVASTLLADELLKNCPNLKILATSREPLRLAGEAQYRVPPLGQPDNQSLFNHLLEFESVRLFEERARLVQKDFALNLENAPAVALICNRLTGIPLAIELAAAHVNMFSPQQIALRLDESLTLLAGGNRASLPRHQTMRASIDWSWNLLSKSEQVLLRRLAVFTGGWTLDGAEAVGFGQSMAQIFGLLGGLIAKSLVLVDRERERYHMLETVREYALERLKEAGEDGETRNRHLDFYVNLAEEAEPKLLGKELGVWMKKLNEERENIIAANDWGGRPGSNAEKRFRLLGGTRYYWAYAGLAKLGYKIYSEALSEIAENHNSLAVGLTYDGAAVFAYTLGESSVIERAEKSIAIIKDHGDPVRLAMALGHKAMGYVILEEYEEAVKIYLETLAVARQTEDKRPVSSALNNLAELYRMLGEYERAIPLYEEAVEIDRDREDSTGIVVGYANLAKNKLMLGQTGNTRSQLAEAAQLVEEAHLREYMQSIIEAAAVLRFIMGDQPEGVRLFGASEAEIERKGIQRDKVDGVFIEHWTNAMCKALGEALYHQAIEEGGKMPYEEALAETREWLENGLA